MRENNDTEIEARSEILHSIMFRLQDYDCIHQTLNKRNYSLFKF